MCNIFGFYSIYLIFIPPNNLAFARANAGVGGRGMGGRGVGGPRGKQTLLSLFVGIF